MPPATETETEAMIEWVLKDAASSYFYTRLNGMLLTFASIWKLAKKLKKMKMHPGYGGDASQNASGLGSIWSTLSQALCPLHFTTATLTGGGATIPGFISKL